ncbi:MAG: AI-2E family transporter, partial [Desulfobacteraceae bacterium]|nr:AI-2E family transporter [Desulfobacteraceae bacterium]
MIQLFRQWVERYFSDPQIIILAILLIFGFLLIFFFGGILAPVFAAMVIAYLLDGMVVRMEQWRVPRIFAVLVVFLLFVTCALVLLIGLLPSISRQVAQLLQDLPSMVARGQKLLMRLPERYPEIVSDAQIQQFINFLTTGLTGLGDRLLSLSLASVRGLITAIIYIILVPLMVFFFLKDKSKILGWMKAFLPENRKLADTVYQEVNNQVANYVRGKVWELLIIWGITYATFSLLGVRYATLLSLFVGLSVLIPYIGVTVMFLPVGLVAFAQWGLTPPLFYALLAYSIIQLLDGNLLAPLLLSEVVNLHPVAIIAAVLLFGGLWGVWGLFFAIPLATLVHAVIKVLLGRPQKNTESRE